MLILFLILFTTVNALYECSQNAPPILTINDLTFFQTPNFPQAFIGNNSSTSCDIQIKAENPNDHILIVMLNGAASRLEFFNGSIVLDRYTVVNYSSNFNIVDKSFSVNSLTMKTFHNSKWQNWTAYQASAFPYDPALLTSSCPLSTKSFDLNENPDLIIPITFPLEQNSINTSCNWMFNVGTSQELKIVVRQFGRLTNAYLTLYADGNILYSFTKYISSDTDPLTLYFNGTSFNLVFATNNLQNSFHGGDFFILVSAVKSSKEFTSDGCQVPQINGYTTTYTNIDYKNGYPAYQRCENIITFPSICSNCEAMIGVYEYSYEACCDFLYLTYGKNESIKLDGYFEEDDDNNEIYTPNFQYLTSKANGSILSFTSDGNIQEAGYKVILTAYECVCGKEVYMAECNSTVRVTPLNNNENFCDNMDCNYQITSNCPNSYFRIHPMMFALRDEIDWVTLKNNGKLVENYTSDSDDDGYHNFLKDNNYTISFHSGTTKSIVEPYKLWYIDIIPVFPKFNKIELNKTTTNHVFWLADMNINDAYSVCASEGQLDMFVTVKNVDFELYFFELFDDNNLQNYVGNFDGALTSASPELPKSRKSTSGCFTIYNHNVRYAYRGNNTILFKIDKENHCKNNISVLQIPKANNPDDYYLSFSSTASGNCEATILTYITNNNNVAALPYLWIYSINTTATENIIFKSAINQKLLFEVKPNEVKKWHGVGVYTTAINIILPSNAEIHIIFAENPVYINPQYLIDGQKGIMASPSYVGYTHNFDILKLYSASTYAELVVKDFYGNPDIIYYSYLEDRNYTLIPSMNLSVIASNVQLFYKETDASKNGFLIEYTLSLNDPSTTTTSSIILTTSSLKTTKTTTSKPITSNLTTSPLPANSTISMTSTFNSISTSTLLPTTSSLIPTTTVSTDTVTKSNKTDNNIAIFITYDIVFLLLSAILSYL